MARSTRLLLGLILVALVLGGIWWWLVAGLRSGRMQVLYGTPDEMIAGISSIMGGAIGVMLVGGLIVVAILRGRGQ